MLLKGIFYDAKKKKWRLRLYKNGVMVHLSHHNDKESAVETLLMLRTPDPRISNPTGTMELIHRLKVHNRTNQ